MPYRSDVPLFQKAAVLARYLLQCLVYKHAEGTASKVLSLIPEITYVHFFLFPFLTTSFPLSEFENVKYAYKS